MRQSRVNLGRGWEPRSSWRARVRGRVRSGATVLANPLIYLHTAEVTASFRVARSPTLSVLRRRECQLPAVVTVPGGRHGPGVTSSVDRTFERATYVVFPVNSSLPFEDNACTLTQRTTTALDVINPLAAEPPENPNAPEAVTTTIGVERHQPRPPAQGRVELPLPNPG